MQMVGVRQNHRGAERLELVRVDGLHGPLRTNGHEAGGRDVAVRRAEHARARAGALRLERERKITHWMNRKSQSRMVSDVTRVVLRPVAVSVTSSVMRYSPGGVSPRPTEIRST